MSPSESVQRRVHVLSDELRDGHLEREKFSEFRRESREVLKRRL